MKSGKIDALAFIGSSRVADILKKQHPKPHRMRSILGLEAKNAAIILKDADLEIIVKEVVLGALSYYGQQVSIFGENEDQIARLIDPLVNQVCRVNLNSQCQRGPDTFPFTGRKDSAEGTLSVSDALRVFTIRTLVAAKDTDMNKKILKKIMRENKSSFLSTDYIL